MQKNILNRWVIIIAALLFSIILLINDFQFYSDKNPNKKTNSFLFDSSIINLGLDLNGGVEYLLSPKVDKWILQKINNENVNANIKKDVYAAIDKFKSYHVNNLDNVIFDLDTLEKYLKGTPNQSTISNVFQGQQKEQIKEILNIALEGNKNIIQNRIDEKGVIEPSIRVTGGRISVEIPGDQNITKLEQLITSSALLEFSHMIYGPNDINWQKQIYSKTNRFPDLKNLLNTIPGTDFIYIKKENLIKFKERVLLKTHPWFETYKFGYLKPGDIYNQLYEEEILDYGDRFLCILDKNNPGIRGSSVKSAKVQGDGTLSSEYVIALEFDSETSRKWGEYTGENIGKIVAITLDNEILTAPVIQSRIQGGGSLISGFSNYENAENVTIALNNGKFNIPLQKEYEYKSGPELGKKMIYLGSFAFIIGISCVIVFMIIYYKMAGLIASISLIMNIIFMSSILSFLGATLTLPGIAGFILTVGIAVDANVIIFERIKEELKRGTPPLSAIESGYDRAFITILDANITTLLTALILYLLGSGPIKGFAITLSAGILCSMFSAIYITRSIFLLVYQNKNPKKINI